MTQTIATINDITNGISSSVSEQNAAVGEIANSASTASRGSSEVVSNIEEIHQAASSSGAAANELDTNVGALSGQIETLHRTVSDFLKQLRAG